jgi:hypothetical protein
VRSRELMRNQQWGPCQCKALGGGRLLLLTAVPLCGHALPWLREHLVRCAA